MNCKSENHSPAELKRGMSHMKDPLVYIGVATSTQKRDDLKVRGLLPPAKISLELEVERSIQQFHSKVSALEKYIYLQNIQDVNERLYYAILVKYTPEVMPIVYTPTVGEACQKFSSIYRGTMRGLYLSINDLGSIRKVLENWPVSNVTTIVVTDGERILGLGDLGVNGMGIAIGKVALYVACAGINPSKVLPVHLDTGTNNKFNLEDPFYLGLRQERERGPAYDQLIEEFFNAARDKFGRSVLIQFEDFGNINAFRLLRKFRHRATTFNDDIQGTAAVTLAGLIASARVTGKALCDNTFLFFGAGEAGTGIAELIAYAISIEVTVSVEEARKKVFLVDSKGLITKSRLEHLQPHKVNFAHDIEECIDLSGAIQCIKPSVLVGVSAMPKIFDRSVCKAMAEINERPVIFALSNPTSKAECTAREAYEWTDGRAVFSSGSPFDAVILNDGRKFVPGQGNNSYIFPGIGLGVLAAGSTKISDHDMLIAARTLASEVTEKEIEVGCLYPPLSSIRHVSSKIAAEIALYAHDTGVATNPKPSNMLEYCKSLMYDPFAEEH